MNKHCVPFVIENTSPSPSPAPTGEVVVYCFHWRPPQLPESGTLWTCYNTVSSGLTAVSSAPVIRENNLSLSTSMLLDTESLEYYILLEAGIDHKGSALIELEKDWNIRVTSCYHFFSVVGWDVGRRSMDAPNIYLSIPVCRYECRYTDYQIVNITHIVFVWGRREEDIPGDGSWAALAEGGGQQQEVCGGLHLGGHYTSHGGDTSYKY